ncbi:hypothetical protein MTO96_030540 [Rhipicephalus appendiculatus]
MIVARQGKTSQSAVVTGARRPVPLPRDGRAHRRWAWRTLARCETCAAPCWPTPEPCASSRAPVARPSRRWKRACSRCRGCTAILVARANNLVYRLQDVLLQEESNRLRKQMHWIATLPALGDEDSEFWGESSETYDLGAPFPDWTRPSTATATSAKKSTSKTFLTFRSFKKRVAKTVGRVASPKKKKGKRSPTAPAQSTSTELCCSKL